MAADGWMGRKDPPRQKKAGWATLSCKFIASSKLAGWATRQKPGWDTRQEIFRKMQVRGAGHPYVHVFCMFMNHERA